MKGLLIISLAILACYDSNSQEMHADSCFITGVRQLFDGEFTHAKQLFTRAYRLYERNNSDVKMNECLMALGTVEFSMGDIEAALVNFELAQTRHLRIWPENKEGLQLIKDNIDLCLREKKQRGKSGDPTHD